MCVIYFFKSYRLDTSVECYILRQSPYLSVVCFSCSFLSDAKQPSILDALSKPKPSSKTAAKSVPSFDSSDSEADVKVTKAKPVLKRKQVMSDDSDSSSDDLMSRLKAKTTAGSKVSFHTEFRVFHWSL